jgi:transposase InsO family protein
MSFKSLNAIQFTRETMKEALNFLLHKKVPEDIKTESSIYRFKRRWRNFVVNEKQLEYAGLKVIPKEDVNKIIKEMYDDPAIGGSIGRDKLYAKIKQQYLGITKQDVEAFLDNRESHQLTLPVIKGKVVKPLMTKRPNQHWQMDLIVLKKLKSSNKEYKYILTVIDTFSKFAWAVPLKSKKGDVVAKAVENIILQSGKKPSVWQSDNGKEFKNEYMTRVMNRFGIKQIYSLPYTPQSNGAIENFNKVVKRGITEHFIKTGKQVWTDVLNDIVYNWNNSKHGTIKEVPSEVHDTDDIEILSQVRNRIKQKAENILNSQSHLSPIDINTWVRVSKLTTTQGRKNRWEKLTPNWSKEIYQVIKMSKPNVHKKEQYTLKDENGKKQQKVYYREDLQPIDKKNLINDAALDEEQTNKLDEFKNTLKKWGTDTRDEDIKKNYKNVMGEELNGKLTQKKKTQVVAQLKEKLNIT